ncbi:MAG TPA: hypothetical protein PLE74_06450 [Candidatus Cloacimonadota bacterium]|nr:hypothetical protein [Candidatus Cloacimonadota bacterium]HPT71903.1 hypothetical protein [Candidatus Cloacimonadota bacterium]
MLKERLLLALGYFTGRMREYEEVLDLAERHGYRMISLDQYLRMGRPSKCIILRHDIDYSSPATLQMLKLEKKYNATASYYFRHNTMKHELMKRIEAEGCEVSLHYETLATWAIEHDIQTREQLNLINWKPICLDRLSKEIRNMRALGFPCRTIASHGTPRNIQLKTANYFLFYDEDYYDKLDIDLETYNREFIAQLDTYIMDGDKILNRGWYYGKSPQEAIQEGQNRILILTHPHHWHYNFQRAVYHALKALYRGPKTEETRFELD